MLQISKANAKAVRLLRVDHGWAWVCIGEFWRVAFNQSFGHNDWVSGAELCSMAEEILGEKFDDGSTG